MRIEVIKKKSFKSTLLDALQNEPDVKKEIVEFIKKLGVRAFEESLSEVLRLHGYLDGDEI